MKKFARCCIFLAALILLATGSRATNLTGTFKNPDGSPVTGKLILRLSQAAKLSDNSAQVVPLVKIFSVTSGQLEAGAFVYGNDVLVPTGTYYVARLVDSNNNLLFEQKWSITGTNLDLGTLTPTTIGVVLADPLVRNVTTSQVVQGPVTFSSPVTAFSLTMNGNLNPGVSTAYDLGNPTLPWREIYTQRWNGNVQPGTTTGTVTAPATAPGIAVDASTGGALDNTTRYIRTTLITFLGETTPSPAATFTTALCGTAVCKFSVNVGGGEWKQGAFGFRVYACADASSTVTCYRQTGFPEELDTTGALANAHYSPGTVILSSITLSGTTPPTSNTATIDADQVALNTACSSTDGLCYGTLQYKQNPSGSYAQTGTSPLVVAVTGAKIQGHGVSNLDDIRSGSTRNCTFAHIKLGCVMVMNDNAVKIDGLSVQASDLNGYMLSAWPSSFNQIEISNASARISGTKAVAPVRIRGIWYYLRFPNLQLYANTSGTGANRGAAVLLSNNGGANWKFSGPVRWTVNDNNDAFRNDLGHTDPDRGNSTAFPAMIGEFKAEDIQIQWGTTGTGQGVLLSGGNWVPNFNRVSHSDYSPAAGAPAFIQLGADANGAAACCTQAWFTNSPALSAHANNAAWLKMALTASGNFSLLVENVTTSHANLFDLNNVSLSGLTIQMPGSTNVCNPAATSNKIINAIATTSVQCSYAANNGITANRIGNSLVTGGLALVSDADRTKNRHFFWSGADTLVFTAGDPTVTTNYLWQSIGAGAYRFFDSSGNALLDLDRANTALGIGRTADPNSALAFPNNRRISFTNAASSAFVTGMFLDTSDRLVIGGSGTLVIPTANNNSDLGVTATRWRTGYFATTVDVNVATGTAPFVISSLTEVANLNTQKWHGKDAIDFSASLDFPSIAAQDCATLTITASGAVADNPVASSWPAALEGGLVGFMHVTGNDTVTVRLCNVTASAIDPASRTFAGRVIK